MYITIMNKKTYNKILKEIQQKSGLSFKECKEKLNGYYLKHNKKIKAV